MRSRFTNPSQSTDKPIDPLEPDALYEVARRARAERAMILGVMIAEAIVWVVRLPRRIAARLAGDASERPLPSGEGGARREALGG